MFLSFMVSFLISLFNKKASFLAKKKVSGEM